jgi:hypothetical protein
VAFFFGAFQGVAESEAETATGRKIGHSGVINPGLESLLVATVACYLPLIKEIRYAVQHRISLLLPKQFPAISIGSHC